MPNTNKEKTNRLEALENEKQKRAEAEAALGRSEEKIRRILEDITDIYFIADKDTTLTEISPSFEYVFQYKIESFINRQLQKLFADRKESERFSSILSASRSVTDFEFAAKDKDGRTLDCMLNARLHEPSSNTGPRVTGTIRDITQRKQAERELQKSRKQLYQSQKMEALGTLVAGVAHEINNPINLIMYNTPLLSKVWGDFLPVLRERAAAEPHRKYGGLTFDFLAENLHQLLSDVDMAASRVVKIITDLKNFARQSSVADKKPIQINAAIKNAMRLVQTTLRKTGVKIEMNLAGDLPLMEGNLHNIEQIILNIIINAIQAINHDHGLIKIGTELQAADGRICVTIADNGHGVDPALADKLFDPFVTNKQSAGGTGLGLSVSYSLLKAHDGDITFESQSGSGTTFSIYFPTVDHGRKAKILVVDDDPAIRRLLTRAFSVQRAYLVDQAANGVEACIKLGTYHPALLILDVFMPDMDGVEVCRAITNDPELADVKVIVTTGFPEHPKLAEVSRLGFGNIIGKPFKMPEFIKFVDNILTQ